MESVQLRIRRDDVETVLPAQRTKIRIVRATTVELASRAWNLHSHSQFSHKDALPEVKDMVATVAGLGQPALGLTDHGNMAGAVQLYTHARKAGLLPFPGTELYVVPDRAEKKAKRHHMCVVAYTSRGYENLVGLSTLTHRNFHNKPLVDHADLATLADQGLLEGLAATSGCFFSLTSQAVVRGDVETADSLIKAYAGWFPRFYVELQNHNIDHGPNGYEGWNDDRLADVLHARAEAAGLPCVLTQDAHYCGPDDRATHDILKRIVAWGPEADDAVFPGDGFHLADGDWFRAHHHPSRLEAGLSGLADLLGAYDLKIPELDSYSYNIPFTVADPDTEITRRCFTELEKRGMKNRLQANIRLKDELEIVKDTGMAGYLQLVAEVTDWCRQNRVFYQARGSASGSMICWLLGITQLDPLKWDLRFERFISRDRTKPPDIDLDIEHDRRRDLIAWLRTRFSVNHIGTWLKYSLKGEYDDAEGWGDEAPKGSLRVAYFARLRAIGVDPIPDWKDIAHEDKRDLYTLDAANALSTYGVHAAGLIVTTTTDDMARLVPLMYVASSETMVSQYDMGDVETLGLVKLDVLGLKTLTVLNRCLTFMGRDVLDGLDWIPLTDAKTFSLIARGQTDGVFQLEGGSSKRGCRDLKPSKISDVVAAMALFRPATMESGATESYLARKHKREEVPVRHEYIAKHTGRTYGVMLYQEQVIAILRELGMSPDELTSFLKAIKASQKDEMVKAQKTIHEARIRVHDLATDAGMTSADFDWLWHAIEGFAKYGFNQAHSSAYGVTAYRTAYLITHHPLEYHAALLNVASSTKKEPIYVSATRARGLRLLRADVNASGISYAPDPRRKGIRRGLTAIAGIGDKVATEIVSKRPDGGYDTLDQLCRLVHRPKSPVTGIKAYLENGDLTVGTIAKLHQAGALGCFEEIE